ncbi:MAG: serine/threonine-protein kinase [Gemmatimonadota bacterium]
MPQPSPEFLSLQQAVAGRFSLERELGRGGMGIVFLARDVALDRPVAIKLLPPHFAHLPELRSRFLREARTAARLSHPHIVPIHLVEELGALVFFVMAYVDGESLGDRVRGRGPITPTAARRLVQEVAWALGYAHQHGVIHRDIKPDNIMLDRASGRAMVTDFGIARLVEADTERALGEIVGTVSYMSPEQALGQAVDGRSDLYSLGVTAFYALTGRLPFVGPNIPAVIHQHVNVPAPRLATQGMSVPAQLAETIDRCLTKEPSRRWPTGEALAESVALAGASAPEVPPQVRSLLRLVREGAAFLAVVGAVILPIVVLSDLPRFLLTLSASGKVYLGLMALAGLLGYPSKLLMAARRVLKDGYDAEHVRLGLVAEANAQVEELLLKGDSGARQQKNRESLIRWSPVVLGLSIVMIAGGLLGPDVTALAIGSASLLAAAVGLAARPAVEPESPLRALGLVERMMIGQFGSVLFRLAGLGLRRPDPVVSGGEATEVVLASAVEDLFEGLAPAIRKRLASLPRVIHRLESHAIALRNREAAIGDALVRVEIKGGLEQQARQEAVADELVSARVSVRERIGAAVGALENLRLGLLRLIAGVGSPDDLTADLERAQAIGDRIDAELAARREIPNNTKDLP